MTSVLIVEDEGIVALDLQNQLQAAGYQVAGWVASAEAAIAQVQQSPPDVVLMDIHLSNALEGVQAGDRIRQTLDTPVVYLTGDVNEATLAQAQATQPFGYLRKPLDVRNLIPAIEIALSRHQAESATRSALAQAQQWNEQKSRFVSIVSHEFRNSLSTILFSTELLQCHGSQISEQRQRGYLQRIQGSVQQMEQLLTDMLTLGETETQGAGCGLKYCPQPLDVGQFCQGLVEEYRGNQPNAVPIGFTYQDLTETSEPKAHPGLDERLLRYVLTNLLSNAVKYSPAGQAIEFQVIHSAREIVFSIQDQGIGIPVSEQANLFQAFYRASNTKNIPGTGLGLSIVKQCVDLQGGTIAVVSNLDQGTQFTVTLPLAPS